MKPVFDIDQVREVLLSDTPGPLRATISIPGHLDQERLVVPGSRPGAGLLIPGRAYGYDDLETQGFFRMSRREMDAQYLAAAKDLSWHRGEEVRPKTLDPEAVYLGDEEFKFGVLRIPISYFEVSRR